MLEFERVLKQVQDKISSIDTSENYKEYSKQELEYWYHCCKWLYFILKKDSMDLNILDVGCAYGTLSCYAKTVNSNSKVYPLDITEILGKRVAIEFNLEPLLLGDIELMDISTLPLMDIIIFTEIIEHLYYDPLETLLKLKSILKPNGFILVSTPDSAEWGRVTDIYNSRKDMPKIGTILKPEFKFIDRHIYQYSEGELHELFSEAGLKIVDFYYSLKQFGGRHLNYLLKVQ